LSKYQQAKKIYDSSLPSFHPDRALLSVDLGNAHLAAKNYQMALKEYEAALKLQEAFFPADHKYIARTLHNLAIVYAYQENMEEANKYLKRAQEIANQTFSLQHPVMTLLDKTKDFLID
jgi:tetratricopeptide (TPR) repeat protein